MVSFVIKPVVVDGTFSLLSRILFVNRRAALTFFTERCTFSLVRIVPVASETFKVGLGAPASAVVVVSVVARGLVGVVTVPLAVLVMVFILGVIAVPFARVIPGRAAPVSFMVVVSTVAFRAGLPFVFSIAVPVPVPIPVLAVLLAIIVLRLFAPAAGGRPSVLRRFLLPFAQSLLQIMRSVNSNRRSILTHFLPLDELGKGSAPAIFILESFVFRQVLHKRNSLVDNGVSG